MLRRGRRVVCWAWDSADVIHSAATAIPFACAWRQGGMPDPAQYCVAAQTGSPTNSPGDRDGISSDAAVATTDIDTSTTTRSRRRRVRCGQEWCSSTVDLPALDSARQLDFGRRW